MERLVKVYQTNQAALGQELGLKNPMAVPRVRKVTINVGLNQARADQKKIDRMTTVIASLTGQTPSLRRARKAISSFKLRAGDPVGLALTLRGDRMYNFLERLIRVALPRVRDFRGISTRNLDGQGNLSIGLREVSVFPEIRYEDADVLSGMEVTIVTTAATNEQASSLLKHLGLPLVQDSK
jgi:large subunit ribosomal protein L5